MMLRPSFLILLLGSLLFVTPARADEVILKNGDRITGNIKSTGNDLITIETDYAGTITIKRSAVSSIRGNTDSPTNREKPASALNPKAENAAASVFSGPFFGLLANWDGNANFGFSISSGNSNNSTMTTGLRATKTTSTETLTIYVRSLWNSTRSRGRATTTQNAYWGGIRFDRNFGRRLFSFISYDFERDRPKKLSFRSVPGVGIGRHIRSSEESTIDFIAGGAWNRTFQNGPNTDTPEVLSGITVKQRLNPRVKLQKSFTFYQNATDLNEYRFLLDATLNIDVTKRVGFYITAGDRFNNDPAGQSRKNDFLLTTGIKWSFGSKR